MNSFTADSISQTLFEINKSMKNIDKTLARIADALEKQTAPSVDGKKLLNVLTNAYIDEMDKRWEAFEKTHF